MSKVFTFIGERKILTEYKICIFKTRICNDECNAYDSSKESNCKLIDYLSSIASILEEIEEILKDA